MYHKLYQVTNFAIVDRYTLRIEFDDESTQVINFEPVLYGQMWGPLRDLTLFNQVAMDPIAHTLCWPNGADFDPETLRNWPNCQSELAARAQTWARVPA